jgi:hypothetical protein
MFFVLMVCSLLRGVAVAQGLFRLNERDEIELGRRAAIEAEKEHPVLDDWRITRYVNRLGQDLAFASGRTQIRYQFKVLDNTEIHAFALPGGFIYVTRGMIESMENESELAGVISHEIAHVVARHHVGQARRAAIVRFLGTTLGWVIGRDLLSRVTTALVQRMARGSLMRFSREAEREADRIATQTLFQAGYDPRGLMTVFSRLASIRQQTPGRLDRFFATHPSFEERTDNVAEQIQTLGDQVAINVGNDDLRAAQDALKSLGAPERLDMGPGDPIDATIPNDASEERDREIAAIFAPIFYQGLGESPRYDYITNFDFDGDWKGDNNWQNAADSSLPLRAFVYYSVAETSTHFLVHYAVFHPRDYKGGASVGALLSRVIRAGVSRGRRFDPTGRADEAVLAHENDLEGCLVVAEKNGDDPVNATTLFVETLSHNRFLRYARSVAPDSAYSVVPLIGRRPVLFIEPKGHGIEAYRGADPVQASSAANGILVYTFTGHADDPDVVAKGPVGYDLVPIYRDLWPKSRGGANQTYGEWFDFGIFRIAAADPNADLEIRTRIGRRGAAFNGPVGGAHMARPPWGWFDSSEPNRPLGEWFFDPAGVVKRHFLLEQGFSLAYLHNPPMGLIRGGR